MVLWILNAVMVRPDVMVLIDINFRIMLHVMYTLWIVYSESVCCFVSCSLLGILTGWFSAILIHPSRRIARALWGGSKEE